MEHLVLPETQGEGNMNQVKSRTYWDVQAQTDVAKIAKSLRRMISLIPGAVFSVRINRQWSKNSDKPHSVISISGMIKLWGDDYTPEKHHKSVLMLRGVLKDVAEEHQLDLFTNEVVHQHMLIQYH